MLKLSVFPSCEQTLLSCFFNYLGSHGKQCGRQKDGQTQQWVNSKPSQVLGGRIPRNNGQDQIVQSGIVSQSNYLILAVFLWDLSTHLSIDENKNIVIERLPWLILYQSPTCSNIYPLLGREEMDAHHSKEGTNNIIVIIIGSGQQPDFKSWMRLFAFHLMLMLWTKMILIQGSAENFIGWPRYCRRNRKE